MVPEGSVKYFVHEPGGEHQGHVVRIEKGCDSKEQNGQPDKIFAAETSVSNLNL